MTAALPTPRRWAALLAGVCVAALAFAFLLQYGFDLAPCPLCVWQRYPFGIAAGLGLLAALGPRPRLWLGLAVVTLLVGAGLSAYHVGIEQGIFALPETCAAEAAPASIEDLRAQLSAAPVRCDRVAASFLGLSLPAWTGLAALGLAILTAVVALRKGFVAPRAGA